MNNKIPCEVIKDLLPLYIDELTSEITNKEIEEHVSECEGCKECLNSMRSPEVEIDVEEETKIDLLKKTRKKHKMSLIMTGVFVFALAALIFCYNMFAVTMKINPDYVSCYFEVTGQTVHVKGNSSDVKVKKVSFEEDNGVIYVDFEGSNFLKGDGSFEDSFEAEGYINMVVLGGKIVWSEGEAISPMAARLYLTYHDYVGDMPANGEVVTALNMTSFTGNFTNELKTDEEPYEYTIKMTTSFSAAREEGLIKKLRACGCALLAEIGNLSKVNYKFSVDGQERIVSITTEEASEMLGFNVKDAGTDINLTEKMVRITGLDQITVENPASKTDEDRIIVEVANFIDDEIYGMGIEYENGENLGSQYMENANGIALSNGQLESFDIIKEDIDYVGGDGSNFTLYVVVTDQNGNSLRASGSIEISQELGRSYKINLYGNKEEGYIIRQ